MKSMTCNQLGGACDKIFTAETFDEMVEISKQYGMEMFQHNDEAHLQAMNDMMELMKNPDEMTAWFEGKSKEFENLADD